MNSALCAGCWGESRECRQPILQTRSCLVPLHLLKAFCTQRLWRHSLDEFREWTIKAFTMCFKGRISFSKLSHVSIHFLFLLIFGLFFFPPLVQLYSVCSAFSCLDFVPLYTALCIPPFFCYSSILFSPDCIFSAYFLCFPYPMSSLFLFILTTNFSSCFRDLLNKIYSLFIVSFKKC